ncbi:hypothetical protein COCON_G00228490 [Conger conger]|uniref:SCA7 domain-containing protein n=1 Tax=Conger conger TaxID=82655 RepID=A0A9Q1HMI6_CONCO|nr:hypothetical protein COCON_G00228490 [Conger conger]
MATLDRKVPSPNTFLYKPWSAFVEAVKLQNSDIAHVEDTGKDFGNGREARKLSREDMPLYGQYPAHDQLCLVVCNTCSLVVKPQSFLSHYERRHAPPVSPAPPGCPTAAPCSPGPAAGHRSQCTPRKGPAASPVSLCRWQPPAPPPPLDRKHQNGTKPYKRVSGRVFDPNKHCGVLDPEGRKPCTRSLTCKTHSLTHRRAVPGRVKQFDSLLAEHKGRHLREQQGSHTHPSRPGQSQEPSSSSSAVTDSHEARSTSLLKSRLANAHIPSVAPGPGAEGVSSEEGEVEPPEDLDCPCSSHHPRPMGCCAFGGRLMGRGYYVFDRRRDRLRLALHCMVEKHVSTHMWSVSMVTYSTAFPHVGATGGVFSIVDSASLLPPSRRWPPVPLPRQPRPRPAKPRKPATCPHGGGNCHAPLPPPSPHQPSPAISSNGTAPSVPKPRPGPRPAPPLPFSGDHALFARADGRKRKSSSPAGRPSNTPKPAPSTPSTGPQGQSRPTPPSPDSQRYITEGGGEQVTMAARSHDADVTADVTGHVIPGAPEVMTSQPRPRAEGHQGTLLREAQCSWAPGSGDTSQARGRRGETGSFTAFPLVKRPFHFAWISVYFTDMSSVCAALRLESRRPGASFPRSVCSSFLSACGQDALLPPAGPAVRTHRDAKEARLGCAVNRKTHRHRPLILDQQAGWRPLADGAVC